MSFTLLCVKVLLVPTETPVDSRTTPTPHYSPKVFGHDIESSSLHDQEEGWRLMGSDKVDRVIPDCNRWTPTVTSSTLLSLFGGNHPVLEPSQTDRCPDTGRRRTLTNPETGVSSPLKVVAVRDGEVRRRDRCKGKRK